MSVVTIGFLVMMVLLGGVVALIADNLGRRIGKKRLKIHHRIRPRHTATMFVVGSGLLIPLLTVALVSWLSKDIRTWLLEGERAIADVRQLRPEVDRLKGQREDLQGDLDVANRQKATAEKDARNAVARRKELDAQVTDLSARASEFRSRIATIQSQFRLLSGKLNAKEKELSSKISALNVAIDKKNEIERLFGELRRQRDDAYAYLQQVQKDIEANDRTIKDQLQQIQSLNSSKMTAQQEFDRQIQAYQRDLVERQKQLDDVRKDLQEGEAELKRVTEAIGSLLAVNETTRKRRMVYGIGDEVARLVVSEDLSISQARNQVTILLRSARVSAEANGAKGSGRVGAAGIFDQEIDGRIVTAEQQTNELVARIAGVPQSRILVASSIWNSYIGEPVPLGVASYPNKLCFRAGDVLGEVRIDGDLPAGQVLAALSNWLSTDVRQAALEAGLIPMAGRLDALASVAPEDIYEIVTQIKSQSRVARVQAVAFGETYAAGPLKLEFKLRNL